MNFRSGILIGIMVILAAIFAACGVGIPDEASKGVDVVKGVLPIAEEKVELSPVGECTEPISSSMLELHEGAVSEKQRDTVVELINVTLEECGNEHPVGSSKAVELEPTADPEPESTAIAEPEIVTEPTEVPDVAASPTPTALEIREEVANLEEQYSVLFTELLINHCPQPGPVGMGDMINAAVVEGVDWRVIDGRERTTEEGAALILAAIPECE